MHTVYVLYTLIIAMRCDALIGMAWHGMARAWFGCLYPLWVYNGQGLSIKNEPYGLRSMTRVSSLTTLLEHV